MSALLVAMLVAVLAGQWRPSHADVSALARDPVVAGIVPGTVARGTTTRLTLEGSGLAAGTAVVVLEGDSVDGAISATAFRPDAAGTTATVEVSVDARASTGRRVVRVLTAAGASTADPTAGNVFRVR